MQFLTSLFGGSENTILTTILALAIVLVLIILGLWALKVLFKASNNLGRSRNRRLSVVDIVAVDPKRQLLIVRRDNVEHVILTGGPQDLVVESGIPVERQTPPARRPVPAAAPSVETGPSVRAEPAADAAFAPANTVSSRTPLDRIRDMGRPAGQRKSPSLRHTGLMRPVSRSEPAVIPMNPDKSDHPHIDSATSAAIETNGQAKLGAGGYFRDVFKAKGN
ncbi:MAG: flagellar biosynthetic protein FliO [Devosia sp.]|nr:flagellar biosynthetic protein FliO [Devosia sp.]